jgi:hypothetical protein
MTQHRALKQRVRERMARTGESYSTARRHVLAKTAPGAAWPAGYSGGGGVHHDSALLHNVLRASGVTAPHTGEPWSEAMLAGLAGGIGFMYFTFEYKGYDPTMTIVVRHHPEPYLQAALTRAGVQFTLAQTGSAKKATAALRSTLDSGRPAVCAVARDGLPWHEDRGELYGQDPVEVAVVGADGATLYVDDEWTEPLAIEEAEFVAAWSQYRKGKHSLLTIDGPGRPDLDTAVADAVATTCAHLTGPVLGNNFDVNFGFSGAHKLIGQLRDPKKGWETRFAGSFDGVMRRLHDCLEVEYAGPGALRPLYAEFLDEAGKALDRPRYAEAAALFREAGTRWSSVAAAAVDRQDRRALLDELADGVAAAIELEEQAVAVLTPS